jgi:hypothetical protein
MLRLQQHCACADRAKVPFVVHAALETVCQWTTHMLPVRVSQQQRQRTAGTAHVHSPDHLGEGLMIDAVS